MPAILSLVPDEASVSVARRVANIARDKEYIRAVVARYDGLNAFENKLQELGVHEEVAAIVAEGDTP